MEATVESCGCPGRSPRWGMQGWTCSDQSQMAPGLGPVAHPAGRSQGSTSWFQPRQGLVSQLAGSVCWPCLPVSRLMGGFLSVLEGDPRPDPGGPGG